MISIDVGDYCEICWMRPFFKITQINSYPVTQNSSLKQLPGKVSVAVRTGFSSNKPALSLGPLCIVWSLCWEGKENSAAQLQQKEPYQQCKQMVTIIQTVQTVGTVSSDSKCCKLPLIGFEMGQLLEGCGIFLCGETQFPLIFQASLGA